MMNKRTVRIFFKGGEIDKNLGDEAMPLNIFGKISSKHSVEIIVFTNDPDRYRISRRLDDADYVERLFVKGKARRALHSMGLQTLDEYLQLIKCVYILLNGWMYKAMRFTLPVSKKIENFIVKLGSSDVVWFGGGGYFNDIGTVTGVYENAIVCILAGIFGKNIVMTGQGIGPIRKKISKILLSIAFRYVDVIGVRDFENSKIFLGGIGYEERKVIVSGDDAASLRSAPVSKIAGIFKKEFIGTGRPVIGVHFRATNYERPLVREMGLFANYLDRIILKYDANLIFIPMSYHQECDDRVAEYEIFEKMKHKNRVDLIKNEYNCYEIKGIVSEMDYFLGFSYHSLLFAVTQGIPSLALYTNDYYRMKLQGLFKFYDLEEYVLDFGQCDVGGILAALGKLINNNSEIRDRIASETKRMCCRSNMLISGIDKIINQAYENDKIDTLSFEPLLVGSIQ